MFADLLVAIQDAIPELDQKGLSRRSAVSTRAVDLFCAIALIC